MLVELERWPEGRWKCCALKGVGSILALKGLQWWRLETEQLGSVSLLCQSRSCSGLQPKSSQQLSSCFQPWPSNPKWLLHNTFSQHLCLGNADLWNNCPYPDTDHVLQRVEDWGSRMDSCHLRKKQQVKHIALSSQYSSYCFYLSTSQLLQEFWEFGAVPKNIVLCNEIICQAW